MLRPPTMPIMTTRSAAMSACHVSLVPYELLFHQYLYCCWQQSLLDFSCHALLRLGGSKFVVASVPGLLCCYCYAGRSALSCNNARLLSECENFLKSPRMRILSPWVDVAPCQLSLLLRSDAPPLVPLVFSCRHQFKHHRHRHKKSLINHWILSVLPPYDIIYLSNV